jgi:hypothetical protein
MILRIVLAGLIGVFAAIIEVAMVPFFSPWAELLPLMPLIVLVLVSSGRSRALAVAIGGALILDAYTIDHFDLALVRLPAIVFILSLIASRSLTNRSVYATVALTVCGRVLDWGSAWALSFLAVSLDLTDVRWIFPSAPAFILVWDVIFTSALFVIIASFTGRFLTRTDSPYAP